MTVISSRSRAAGIGWKLRANRVLTQCQCGFGRLLSIMSNSRTNSEAVSGAFPIGIEAIVIVLADGWRAGGR